jgi:MYXO-CTERM domain-containing protein
LNSTKPNQLNQTIQMKIKSISLLVTTLSLASLPVFGDTFNFSGDTTSLPTFNRPIEDGSLLSDIGTSVPYNTFSFTVGQTGSYNFAATGFDTFVFLYSSFDPSQPLLNFIAGNDGAPGAVTGNSALGSVSLTSGNSYDYVITGFGNTDLGAFSASIDGPGTISPVPEPTPLALAASGVAGLWLVRRRQTAKA